MKNPITAHRLSTALSNANMIPQELANASGVSKASISQYLNGSHSPSNISSGKMAKILNVNPVWLMGFDVPMLVPDKDVSNKSTQKGLTVNVLGRVAAGIPIEAITDIVDQEEISEDLAKTGEFFGLRIQGNSMEPDIHNGDTVIVKKQDDAESNEIVIALINGNDGVCKRLKKYAESIALVSINPDYEPMYFNQEEIDNTPVRIIGKVVELRRKL
ncbi:LexA family protein [Anaerostipes sp.]|uniref:LexA family protein n=1 Tax=Anaerostipes sp. TaxID=1872530 RepID=UPI002E7A2F36|nr:LexA family transcriptional regulator [Anaerostipes sp.]MED9814730.1 LexA family transcriptional regulator [Anaerostipes sp.]